jgi:cysteine desulfurase
MSEKDEKIYLDYAATTPVDEAVFEVMKPYFSEKYGNASSVHQFGQEAASAVVRARQQVATFLNCQPNEIIFNSGATEGNNTIIKGIGQNRALAKKVGGKLHIIVSTIEHECVFAAAEFLAKQELAEVTFLPVNRDGLIEVEELEKSIKPNTVLVSIMYANNEIGVVQPLAKVSELLKRVNQGRENKIYFHTDAVQAINYLNCDVEDLGVDFLTLSGHKFYGPKGVGVLYARSGARFDKLMHGGEQEFHLRSGTHNTPGIVGLGEAIGLVSEKFLHNEEIKRLRDKLISGIREKVSHAFLNGSFDHRLQNNVNFRFEGVEGEAILVSLDLEGIGVSTGSACAAKSLEPSHVLMAMGLKPLEAHSSVRFSLGRYTTEAEIDRVLEVLPQIIERLRGISGNIKGEGLVERGQLPKDFGC